MAENPLLPNRRLLEMYRLMQRMRASPIGTKQAGFDTEAVLAAAALQLEPSDVLCGNETVVAVLLRSQKPRGRSKDSRLSTGGTYVSPAQEINLPKICPLLAIGAKAEANKSAVVAVTTGGEINLWKDVLTRAQTERLPLLVIVLNQNTRRSIADSSPSPWAFVTRLASSLHLPTISVDGQDALASYRVIQESLHRAKLGDGPVVIWCSFPAPPRSGKTSRSISNLEKYLTSKGLLSKSRISSTTA